MADVCFVLLIYPRSKDEEDTKMWGHNKKSSEINSVQPSGDGKDVAEIGQGQHAFVKQPIQCSVSCAVAVDFSWTEVPNYATRRNLAEIRNMMLIKIFSIINMSWYGKVKNSTVYHIVKLMHIYCETNFIYVQKTNTLKTTEQTEEDHEKS